MHREDREAPASLRRDGIYRTIQWLMLFDIAVGIALILAGAFVLEVAALAVAGAALAAIGAGLFLFFRVLAERELERRSRASMVNADRLARRRQ